MFVDYIVNKGGANFGHGPVGEQLMEMRFDPGYLRPYWANDHLGRPQKYVTINTGRTEFDPKSNRHLPIYEQVRLQDVRNAGIDHPIYNATTLRHDEWIQFDNTVREVARQRLRAWADLAASNTLSVPGMSKTILETDTVSDPGEAIQDMDGIAEGRSDRPLFQPEGIPLPITHSSYWYSARNLAVSRSGGQGLDTISARAHSRRIAELIEKQTIGITTGMTYGDSTRYSRTSKIQGYANFTPRNTYTSVTAPTGSNPEATVANVLAMRDLAYLDNQFGPFMLYHSTDWDQYMDNDYARLGGSNANMTLRDRLRRIDGIRDVRRLDFMTPAAMGSTFNLLLVQMSADTARAIIGMDLTTVMWETKGGMQLNFKIMCIMVPQLLADYNGQSGIVHGTPS